MDRFTGGCLCGSVRIVASGLPYRVGLCHCLDCRKHHGALFHASAIFPEDAVAIEGETRDYAGRTIALVSSCKRKRRQPGLAPDDPALVGRCQLVGRIQRSDATGRFEK